MASLLCSSGRHAIDLIRRRRSLADKLSLLERPERAVNDLDEIERPAAVLAVIYLIYNEGLQRREPAVD
jgi:predicted RNA polymerase sigma factor